jgi:hypothetical protein
VRTKQAKQSRFPFNGRPQIEQTATDSAGNSIVRLPSFSSEYAKQFAQLFVHFGVGVHRSANLGT